MLKYRGRDYNLNNLFQFEMLKQLIEELAKNQIQMNEKLQGIMNPSTHYPIGIDEIENDEIQLEGKEDEIEEEVVDDIVNKGNINKRLSSIERKLNTVKILDKQIKASLMKTDNSNDCLNQTVQKVTKHDNDIINNTNDIKEIKEILEDIRNKISDSNMYEMFKDTSEGIGGNIDTTKGLILNLETKIFKKFNLIDERNKKIEEENIKTKNEVFNIKNKIEVIPHLMNQLEDNLTIKLENVNKENENKQNQMTEIANAYNLEIDKRLKQLELANEETPKKVKLIEENLMKTINSFQNGNNKSIITQNENVHTNKSDKEKEMKYFKDLNRRVIEIEKGIKEIKSSLIFDEINKLEEEIKKRLVKTDLLDINDKILYIDSNIKEIKDIDDIQTNSIQSLATEISLIAKRVENLTGIIISMQDGGNSSNYSSARPMIDLSKYVDMQLFSNEINNISKSLNELTNDSNEYRRKITDLMPLLLTAAKVNDIRTLEKLIANSIEEANKLSNKKFAGKTETNKQMKLIDSQIKQTRNDLMKKNDQSEHWMLASKPVAGYKCASCENEIENLNNNKWEYLPWKKYPLKNIADKSYRV